jgi:TolB-like protein
MEKFTTEKIQLHLQRILKTPTFADSTVLTRFLTFIVNETLEGRSHELKEYTIAIEALKKDVSFNPQIDSIVRIHAGRLRRALKEFYYEDGVNEELQILVRKGSYVPAFVRNCNFPPTAHSEDDSGHFTFTTRFLGGKHKQAMAVLPFEDISEIRAHTSFVKGLQIYLNTCLTSNGALSVTSYLSSYHVPEQIADIHQVGELLNASFILSGCVQFDKHFRVHVLLNACDSGEQLWGITIERKDIESIDLFGLQQEIVNEICSGVFGTLPYNRTQGVERIAYEQAANINSLLTVKGMSS